jgi:hypothetical protein
VLLMGWWLWVPVLAVVAGLVAIAIGICLLMALPYL